MEDFDQLENKKDFRKMILIIGGIILLALAVTALLLFVRGSKESFNSKLPNTNTPVSSTTSGAVQPLFSKDITTWKSYYWPGKINTHYPSNWQLGEEMNKDGLVAGLKITPPTGNTDDQIFIGGTSANCSDILKYAKSKCLKNKIQVPFYTNSKNPEVLNAFDLILQNTILTEVEK